MFFCIGNLCRQRGYAAVISVIIYFHFRRRRHMPPVVYPVKA